MIDTQTLATELSLRGKTAEHALSFSVQEVAGDINVIRVDIEDREELPIFISVNQEQILCIVYLYKTAEIKHTHIHDMHTAMLTANITMPLSSFSKIDDQYVIFGALSVHSSLHDIIHEIETLSSNSLSALHSVKDYLK